MADLRRLLEKDPVTNAIPTYRRFLDSQRDAVREVLLGLDAGGLNWRPLGEGSSSIYNLAQHCAWVETWLIGFVAGGRPFPYDWSENQDLLGSGEDAADLLFWLDEAATTTEQVLAELDQELLDIARQEDPSAHGEPQTRRWAIVHAIEHYAEHLGQMRLTRQLWESRRRTGDR